MSGEILQKQNGVHAMVEDTINRFALPFFFAVTLILRSLIVK
jgi:hypothetical protein